MRPVFYGVAAGIGMFAVYFSILTILNSAAHAISQFVEIWPWMTLLIAGFGFQIGLYFYMKELMFQASRTTTAAAAASGTVSTGSMVACCAHHIVDVLPILGFSALAVLLNTYQTFFLSIGILSNIFGVLFMLRMMQKHRLENNFFSVILKYNIQTVMEVTFVFGAAFLVFILFF